MLQVPEIREKLPQISDICRRYGVRELSLFGSAVGTDFRPESDYDFLVEFHPEAHIGLIKLINMERELGDLLHRKVDLVPKRGLKQGIRDTVLHSAEIVYEG